MSDEEYFDVDIFDFFGDCPDIIPPSSMQELPIFVDVLQTAGQYGWASYFMDLYNRLCHHIEEEVTVHA